MVARKPGGRQAWLGTRCLSGQVGEKWLQHQAPQPNTAREDPLQNRQARYTELCVNGPACIRQVKDGQSGRQLGHGEKGVGITSIHPPSWKGRGWG